MRRWIRTPVTFGQLVGYTIWLAGSYAAANGPVPRWVAFPAAVLGLGLAWLSDFDSRPPDNATKHHRRPTEKL